MQTAHRHAVHRYCWVRCLPIYLSSYVAGLLARVCYEHRFCGLRGGVCRSMLVRCAVLL